jgi:hypothetical protein
MCLRTLPKLLAAPNAPMVNVNEPRASSSLYAMEVVYDFDIVNPFLLNSLLFLVLVDVQFESTTRNKAPNPNGLVL